MISRVRRLRLACVTLGLLFCFNAPAAQATSEATQDAAPVLAPFVPGDETSVAPDRYVVLFKGDPDKDTVKVQAALDGPLANRPVAPEVRDAIDVVEASGGEVTHAWGTLLKGFAARLSDKQVEALRANPAVAAIYGDAYGGLAATQTNPPAWGLDRIDQANLPLDQSYTYANTASSVSVYVLDSGIRATHSEYAGRVFALWNSVNNNANVDDCHSHGTHVAGTVGGSTVGVAKAVKLRISKVIDCAGTTLVSWVVDGMDRTAADVQANNTKPAIVNSSWSFGASAGTYAIELAVARLLAKGIHYVAAASNNSADARGWTPARLGYGTSSLSIGNVTITDKRYVGSNFGPWVNLFGPGTDIRSAYFTGDSNYIDYTGTSMAAPHVAGVAALCLQASPTLTPAELKRRLINCATSNVLDGTTLGTGSPNRLLNVNACACTAGPTFSDMASTYWAYPAVACLDKYGIGFACEATKYCGTSALKRWEMAVYLVEAKKEEGNLPTWQAFFTDVPQGEWWAPYVERLKQLGVTSGCTASTYCPTSDVLRRDMAIFILKAIGQAPLTTYKGYFTDVPAGQYYTGYVEKAKELGIIAGCTATTYCPNNVVTREQTAAMIKNAFALTCP